MGRAWVVILCVVLTAGCTGRKRPVDIPSPDGSMIASPQKAKSTLIITVSDQAGNVLTRWNTGVSIVHRWSVEWMDNSRLLVRSSDIGARRLARQEDGTWKAENPLRKLSPNGKLVAYTYWNDSRAKTLTLSLLEANGDADAAFRMLKVLEKFRTDIVVSDLVDCARWDGDDRLVIKGADGEHRWERASGTGWQQVDNKAGG